MSWWITRKRNGTSWVYSVTVSLTVILAFIFSIGLAVLSLFER